MFFIYKTNKRKNSAVSGILSKQYSCGSLSALIQDIYLQRKTRKRSQFRYLKKII